MKRVAVCRECGEQIPLEPFAYTDKYDCPVCESEKRLYYDAVVTITPPDARQTAPMRDF